MSEKSECERVSECEKGEKEREIKKRNRPRNLGSHQWPLLNMGLSNGVIMAMHSIQYKELLQGYANAASHAPCSTGASVQPMLTPAALVHIRGQRSDGGGRGVQIMMDIGRPALSLMWPPCRKDGSQAGGRKTVRSNDTVLKG